MREIVERWVRALGVHLILASQDDRFRREPDGKLDLAALWRGHPRLARRLAPGGVPQDHADSFRRNHPVRHTVPELGRLLRAWVPRMSQFAAGDQTTVFTIAPGVRIAPMICFDATNYHVAQGMAYNGANLGLVLANLAWFGPSTASVQFEALRALPGHRESHSHPHAFPERAERAD